MSEDTKQCWQCRLISGGGLIFAGSYVVHYGKKLQGFQRYGVTSIGCGLGMIGILRLFNLPPFKSEKSPEKPLAVKEEDEYIIGKFTSKFN